MDLQVDRKGFRTFLRIIFHGLLVLETFANGTSNPDSSSSVGFGSEMLPSVVSANKLGICGSDSIICTSEMEEEMMRTMESYFIESLQSNVKKLSKTLGKKHHILVKSVKEQIELGRKEAKHMFTNVYSTLAPKADIILYSIYDLILSFYERGYHQNTMADYFKNLLFYIFELSNSQYEINDEFKSCMETHNIMGGGPLEKHIQNVQEGIKRRITALRAYTQGLLAGRDAIRSLMWFEPDENCVKETVRMRGCVHCSDNQGSPICSDYCSEVLDICFAGERSSASAWPEYHDAMHSLQIHIENNHKFDEMIQMLAMDIHTTIVKFSERVSEDTTKAFIACGTPPLVGTTPHEANHSLNLTFPVDLQFPIAELVKGIQNELGFSFVDICKDEQISEFNCWNGTAVGNYTLAIFREPLWETPSFSKVQPDITELSHSDTIALRLATKKLRSAIWANNVQWSNYERKILEICRFET
ncbi:glypican-6-like [Oratosquilla oratoria]|uniref:glypican-6-like n=1 Tax=Oratosquilla oratoria TaxID=337810 RepID=UPI003F7675F5